MRVRLIAALAALALVVSVSSVRAQTQTGEIFGKVTDESGAVLPGVHGHHHGTRRCCSRRRRSRSETGSFQFPRLDVGIYNVKFELPGFKTIVKQGIQVTVGFSANVSTQMGVSTVQETVTVTGESPIVDTKNTGTKQTFTTRAAAEHPVGARSVGHPAADRGHRDGPREHRRQHVGPAVQLRVARRQPGQHQVVARRRRHHRHGRDRRVAELLRLRRVPGNDDQHRRRGRHAADRRRRHQPGDQERQRRVPRQRPLLRRRRQLRVEQHQRRAAAPGRHRRATRSRTSRTTASRPAARSRRARRGSGAATASRTSTSACSTSTSRTRRARRSRSNPLSYSIERRQRLPEPGQDAARRHQPQG